MREIRYILWRVKHFALLALGTNLLLGNLCMMPMAMAEDMPDMPGMNHDMSAMASHENPDDQTRSGMPCDGEHCFTHALPTQTSLHINGVFVAIVPTSPNIVELSPADQLPMPVSTAPPGHITHVDTIVMRN